MRSPLWSLAVVACTALSVACLGPASPSGKVADAARELNLAARFGRMDVAVALTAPAARQAFLERRSLWGAMIRVVDLDMVGLEMSTTSEATVLLDYSWTRNDRGVLNRTRIEQRWRENGGTWQLVRERRLNGDFGLFGEGAEEKRPPHEDVHFPTRVIR